MPELTLSPSQRFMNSATGNSANNMEGQLIKEIEAHSGRIVKTTLVSVGGQNSLITASNDRTVKVGTAKTILIFFQ
jgi:hypothetical protein